MDSPHAFLQLNFVVAFLLHGCITRPHGMTVPCRKLLFLFASLHFVMAAAPYHADQLHLVFQKVAGVGFGLATTWQD